MAYILFSQYAYPWYDSWYKPEERLAGKIRLSIFLIAGECGGLPALVWALRVLYRCYKSGGRISALVVMLLLSDLLELLLNPYIVTKLLQNEKRWETSTTCWILTSSWSASKIYGLHLQQAVALEGALAFRHPPCSAHAIFPSCSVITSIIAFISFFLCELFGLSLIVLLSLPLLLVMTLTSCIVTCRAPPQISHLPYRTKKPSSTALAFVTAAVILYGTFTSTCATMSLPRYWDNQQYNWDVFVMGVSLMSLNVIVDPLLCVLVSKSHTDLGKSEVNIHSASVL